MPVPVFLFLVMSGCPWVRLCKCVLPSCRLVCLLTMVSVCACPSVCLSACLRVCIAVRLSARPSAQLCNDTRHTRRFRLISGWTPMMTPGKSAPCSDRSRRFPNKVTDMWRTLAPPSECVGSSNGCPSGRRQMAISQQLSNHSRQGVFMN